MTGLPLSLSAQPTNQKAFADSIDQGIHFTKGLTWRQVITKAKVENKLIFMDCYTTWCGPCRRMENEVYPLEKIGDFYNEKFISVKMQMDTSFSDNADVKSKYADANNIGATYGIAAYPSFLFFSPYGKLLIKDIGLQKPDDFLALAKKALKSEIDFNGFLDGYRSGKRDFNGMNSLARLALGRQDAALSMKIANDYVLSLNDQQLFENKNIQFMADFLLNNSKSKGFQFFYKNQDVINKIMKGDTYAQGYLHDIIFKEIAVPELVRAQKLHLKQPHLVNVYDKIRNKYGSYYAGRIVIAARMIWNFKQKNMIDYSRYSLLFIEKYYTKVDTGGYNLAGNFNTAAWNVFLYLNDKKDLTRALHVSGRALLIYSADGNNMDTYANLLYKLGMKDDALMWEKNAEKLSPDDKNIQANLSKMKKNEPTWPVN